MMLSKAGREAMDANIDERSLNIELGRFFAIWSELREPLAMFSPGIDAAWHRMLERPDAYAEFCRRFANDHVLHVIGRGTFRRRAAGVDDSSPPTTDWVTVYEARFGPLSPAWFTDDAGAINRLALQRYRESGVIEAAWDCCPAQWDR